VRVDAIAPPTVIAVRTLASLVSMPVRMVARWMLAWWLRELATLANCDVES